MAKRNLYLSNLPVEEAQARYLAALQGLLNPRPEEIASEDALDRVSWEALFARRCSPLFNAAAMDGIAVTAAATGGARESSPLTLVRGKDFKVVDTGDPILPPYDAVIMAEETLEIDDDTLQILQPAVSWQHIRPIGEDIVAGEMILPGRRRIRPMDIGVLLSGGLARIPVYRKPRVAIFPTGGEMIEVDKSPEEGEIIESNSRMFAALVREEGGEARRFGVLPDDPRQIGEAVGQAAEAYDMVLINAGSSAGTEDYTVQVLRELGEVAVHGVAMKPGKPVILAVVKGRPVIGIPGYPVSAYLAYKQFAAPVLARLSGRREEGSSLTGTGRIEAVISRRLVSSLKHREYVRVKVGLVDGRLIASPLARGAGAAMSLVRADGFCIIPQNSEGIEAGETAPVELCRPLSEIEATLVSTGSHDLILDIIGDMMASSLVSPEPAYLASTHLGSLGGLMALKRGECHIAPIHLLNEADGVYNVSTLRELFPGEPPALIKGVGRVQGLMVAPGNPLGIRGVGDLSRCRYINRQRGAGTRLFLDYQLRREGIKPESLEGYDREGATHMAVAAAVKNGSADAGMGVSSAAAALGLDFIPLGEEEYDFACPPRFLTLPALEIFRKVLQSPAFAQRLKELGGYTFGRCGELVFLKEEIS
ncbi:MAG: molybdopterin biosynthesis protein [Spirochaetales bacterium]|jgi:putative molybdopterin biosynthesis protein|nr:molybdopterin biosynthesis protein [Spirochaetales bacterium]